MQAEGLRGPWEALRVGRVARDAGRWSPEPGCVMWPWGHPGSRGGTSGRPSPRVVLSARMKTSLGTDLAARRDRKVVKPVREARFKLSSACVEGVTFRRIPAACHGRFHGHGRCCLRRTQLTFSKSFQATKYHLHRCLGSISAGRFTGITTHGAKLAHRGANAVLTRWC